MASLRELQLRFADDLLADGVVTSRLGFPPDARDGARLAVYRRTVRANYRNALGATYPALRRIVGMPFFRAAVDAYAEAHPSRSGDLNEYGDRFADFLAGYRPAAGLPYLPDVARLEWAIDESNRAADSSVEPDAVLGALSRVAADALPSVRLRIEPSCRLLSSAFPLLRIWQVNQSDDGGDLEVDFAAGPDHLRIRREPRAEGPMAVAAGGIVIERIAAGNFEWLSALARGGALSEAIERACHADPTFDLTATLHRLIGDGTIAGVAGPERFESPES